MNAMSCLRNDRQGRTRTPPSFLHEPTVFRILGTHNSRVSTKVFPTPSRLERHSLLRSTPLLMQYPWDPEYAFFAPLPSKSDLSPWPWPNREQEDVPRTPRISPSRFPRPGGRSSGPISDEFDVLLRLQSPVTCSPGSAAECVRGTEQPCAVQVGLPSNTRPDEPGRRAEPSSIEPGILSRSPWAQRAPHCSRVRVSQGRKPAPFPLTPRRFPRHPFPTR